MIQSIIYHSKDFVLMRKPHGVPSTFGKAESFLDCIKKHITEKIFTRTPLFALVPDDIFPFMDSRLVGFQEAENPEALLRHQVDTFKQDQEFGLVNRLDNDTAGFLYFAKSQQAYDHFTSLQKSGKVKKFYLAQISGKLKNETKGSPIRENMETLKDKESKTTSFHSSIFPSFNINLPIMHHKSDLEKMIVIRDSKDLRLGRSKEHHVLTQVDILSYDVYSNVSTLLITITRGIRHQIRVHLASISHPIIGDALYGKKGDVLHLRSIGFSLQ